MRAGVLEILLTGDARQLDSVLNSTATRLRRFGSDAQALGRDLSKYITAPLVGVGAIALKSSIDFESAFAGVRKTVDASEEEFARLRKGILDMSKEIPSSAAEIAGVAEIAGQLGISNEGLLKFTRIMVDLGNSTNIAATDAASALARFANVTQMSEADFGRLAASIVDIGNGLKSAGGKIATTEADIVALATRMASAGAQIGMTQPEIIGMAAALSSVGIEADAGGTALSRVMIMIASAVADGGKDLKEFADIAGMSAQAFSQMFKSDSTSAIIAVVEGLGRMSAAGENVFGVMEEVGMGNVRVGNAMRAAANAGQLMRDAIAQTTDAWQKQTAHTEEAAKRYATNAAKLATLRNEMTAAAIDLGDALMPSLKNLVGALKDVMRELGKAAAWFASLPDGMRKTIIMVVGIVAALGPLIYTIGGIIRGVGSLVVALRVIPPLLSAIKATMIGIGSAGAGPLGLFLAGSAAIYTMFTQWREIPQIVDDAAAAVRRAADSVPEAPATAESVIAYWAYAGLHPDQSEEARKYWESVDASRAVEARLKALRESAAAAASGKGGSKRAFTSYDGYALTPGRSTADLAGLGIKEQVRGQFDAMRAGIPTEQEVDGWLEGVSRAFANMELIPTEQQEAIKAYFKSLHKDFKSLHKDVDEFAQGVKESMDMWLTQASDAIWAFVRGAKDAFRDLVDSILSDLARMWLKAKIVEPLARSIGISPRTSGAAIGGQTQGMQVIVNNNTPAQIETKQTPDGRALEITVNNIVRKGMAQGAYDSTMGQVYGVRRQAVSHG